MTRITVFVAAVVAAATMQAQEKPWRLSYEAGIGFTGFYNYSALSLVEDNTPSYTAPTATFTLGMRHEKGYAFGLRYSNTDINTANVGMKEHATLHDFSLIFRRSKMLSQRMELYGSATLGLAILHNNMVYGSGNSLTRNRYGFSAGLEAGLRYYLDEETYFFVSTGVSSIELTKVRNLPTILPPQAKSSIASAHLIGGFGIAFHPKVKKLNMPAEIIGQKETLQMAYYTDK